MRLVLLWLLFIVLAPLWLPMVLVRLAVGVSGGVYEAVEAYFTRWTP